MMRNILSTAGKEVLQQFAWSNVLVALDYDGTLAPIVSRPERAALRPETRRLLHDVSRLYPVVVISGRAQADVVPKLVGTGVTEVIGNHGIEPRHTMADYLAQVRRWLPVLRARVEALQGVWVEDKTYSVAIHYRQSRRKKLALPEILAAARTLGEIRLIGGKQVVNILPTDAPHKGIALEKARDRLRCDTALYVGDDETDEDVFGLDQPGRLLGVRVGPKRASEAAYYLRNQRALDELLAELLRLRPAGQAAVAGRR
jgi:trehalose 6-phosphate phosphatase